MNLRVKGASCAQGCQVIMLWTLATHVSCIDVLHVSGMTKAPPATLRIFSVPLSGGHMPRTCSSSLHLAHSICDHICVLQGF